MAFSLQINILLSECVAASKKSERAIASEVIHYHIFSLKTSSITKMLWSSRCRVVLIFLSLRGRKKGQARELLLYTHTHTHAHAHATAHAHARTHTQRETFLITDL